MPREQLTFKLDHPRVSQARAILDRPGPNTEERNRAILLAHGAGAPMEHPFMESIATGLAAVGFPVMRFEYPYMARARAEERRLPPDRLPALAAAHRSALKLLREHTAGRPVLLSGKSMGGRVSTLLAAGARELATPPGSHPFASSTCAGLILFGYPLPPAGKPQRLRDAHFPKLSMPSLFLQGTRDSLCQLDLLGKSLESYAGSATLAIFDGADHSFLVRKRDDLSEAEVQANLVETVATWEAHLPPQSDD